MDASRHEPEFERLLTQAAWLSHLARRLVSDPASADDLVQDTWHAALRAPDRRVQNDRGWLATVLANLARMRARSETARRRRERSVAVPEAIDGPDRLVERAEAQRKLLAVVLELDEPYRSTVLERYAQGATSAEIARRAQLNESTVRTRLLRAHEQLRARLGRSGGGLTALAPILSGTHVEPLAIAGSTHATKVAFGTGVGIVGLASKIGVVAIAATCGWVAWRSCAPVEEPLAWSPPAEESSTPAVLDATGESPDARVPLAASDPVAAPPTLEAPAKKPTVPTENLAPQKLEIIVLRDLVPTSGVRIWIDNPDDWRIQDCLDVSARPPSSSISRDTNPLGSAVFTDLDPRAYNFRVGIGTGLAPSAPDRFITAEVFPGYRHEVRLGTASVRGKVFDAKGRERAGAGVQVYTAKPDSTHFYIAAHTTVDERGEYQVGDLRAGSYLVIMEADGRFDGRGEVERIPLELRAGEARVVDFGTPEPAPRWTGRVLNARHEPFPGGSLSLVNERDGREVVGDVDAEGRFDLAIAAGSWSVNARVAGSPQEGFALGVRDLSARDVTSDLIVPGARLVIRLIESARAAEPGPTRRGGEPPTVAIRADGHDYPSAFRDTRLLADGRRVIDGLEPGTWKVSVYPGTFLEGATVNVTIGPDQSLVDLELHWKSR